jgi:hypothetical protein
MHQQRGGTHIYINSINMYIRAVALLFIGAVGNAQAWQASAVGDVKVLFMQ